MYVIPAFNSFQDLEITPANWTGNFAYHPSGSSSGQQHLARFVIKVIILNKFNGTDLIACYAFSNRKNALAKVKGMCR